MSNDEVTGEALVDESGALDLSLLGISYEPTIDEELARFVGQAEGLQPSVDDLPETVLCIPQVWDLRNRVEFDMLALFGYL